METNQYRNVPDVSFGIRNPLHSECGQVSLDWGHANCKIGSRPNYLSMVFWNHFSQIQFFWLTRGQNHHHFDRIGHFLQISFFSFYMISFGKNPYAVESFDTSFRFKMLFFGKTVVFSILGEDLLEESFPFRENSRNEIPLKFSVTNSHFWQQPLWSLGGSQDILKVQTLPLGFEETSFGRIPSDSHASRRAKYIHKFSQVAKIVLYVVLIYKFQTSSPYCR